MLYDGIEFRIIKSCPYYVSKKGIKFHRYIWEKYNGYIPKGYHIHHKDLNKLNNNINNLQCLTASDHMKLHGNGNQIVKKYKYLWIEENRYFNNKEELVMVTGITKRDLKKIIEGSITCEGYNFKRFEEKNYE